MLKQSWFNFKRTTKRSSKFDIWHLNKIKGEDYVYEAPDGSFIRKFQDVRYGGLAHCMLAPKHTSRAKKHKTVDEIWYCIQGRGEMWRKQGKRHQIVTVRIGSSVTIPVGTHFQFRNTGKKQLVFIIATMPPWPGSADAVCVDGPWKPTLKHSS